MRTKYMHQMSHQCWFLIDW